VHTDESNTTKPLHVQANAPPTEQLDSIGQVRHLLLDAFHKGGHRLRRRFAVAFTQHASVLGFQSQQFALRK
jgi:hypothetical protein